MRCSWIDDQSFCISARLVLTTNTLAELGYKLGLTREKVFNYYSNHNSLSIIQNQTDENLKSVRWYIDCGDNDFLYEGNSLVHIALKKRGVPHEYRVRDGAHNWTYWRSALPEVLKFVSDRFHQK